MEKIIKTINIDEFLLQNSIKIIDTVNPSFNDIILNTECNLNSVLLYNIEYSLDSLNNEKIINIGIADIIQLHPDCYNDFILYINNSPVINTTTIPNFILLFNKEIKFKLKEGYAKKLKQNFKLHLIAFTLTNKDIYKLRHNIITNNDGLIFKEN